MGLIRVNDKVAKLELVRIVMPILRTGSKWGYLHSDGEDEYDGYDCHNHDDDDDDGDQVITENQCRSMCLPWEWRPVSSLDCDRVAELSSSCL